MERLRAVLLTLVCVWLSQISGAEVEVSVRPGDNVTLHSDCVWKTGFSTVWLRNCSHQHQPPLIISATAQEHHARLYDDLMNKPLPRYFIVWNSSSGTHDLLVKNVSESDLGLYYCALYEKKITEDKTGRGVSRDVFQYGTRTTRLSLLDTTVPCAGSLQTTSTPPVSDCRVCWKLLVSVCPVCVLLSSTCVYCTYRYTTRGEKKQKEEEDKENSMKSNKKQLSESRAGGGDVCYASLDLPSRGQKPLKKKKRRVESSEFSTYSEVKTDQM